jgi:serine/threonine-protein kinase
MSFVAGETVGPYRIIEQLGSGGMATVFKAYHAALDRYVALKVLHPAFKEDPSFLARFQREARIVAQLDHPNIVPVYDFSAHHGQPYLVMRYIDGETLKARLARGPLSIADTLKMVNAIGAALVYAHAAGVLHRDIKPSNVIITPKGDVFLTDFGLARIAQVGESTLSQDSILGTPQYISPEQAMGDAQLDARTDVYSLGVVLYELLVGRVPYQADTPYAVVHDHIYTPLPPPRSINPKLAEPLERFLLKALAKDRADRYASVAEMAQALNRAVEASGIPPAGPVSTMITTGAAPTVAAPPKTVASTPSAPVTKPAVSPIVWIGLGALLVVGVIALLLVARPASLPGQNQPPRVTPVGNLPPDPGQAARQALNEANALFRQASDQVLQSRPDRARATFEQAAQKVEEGLELLPEPDTPAEIDFRVIASEAWLASGHPDQAEPHLEWLIDEVDDESRPRVGLAAAYLLQDEVDDALAEIEEALDLDPDLAEAHAVKACGLLKDGDRLAAAREFRLAAANADGPVIIPPWMTLVLEQLDCRMER